MVRQLSLATIVAAVSMAANVRGGTPEQTLMILQVGGTTANAQSVSLLEYSIAGLNSSSTPFKTVSVPSTGALALTLQGATGKHDGMIRLSGDGRYVTFGGYRADAGAANPSLALASSVNRVIGKYDLYSETLDTTQAINNIYNFTTINAVVTQDGSRYWLGGGLSFAGTPTPSGNPTNWDLTGGVQYVGDTSTNTGQNIGMTKNTSGNPLKPDEVRSLFISGGELYMTTPAQNSYKVPTPDGKVQERGTYRIGNGTPTNVVQESNPVYTPLLTNVGTDEPGQEIASDTTGKWAAKTDAYFLDLNPGIPGEDTAYGTGGKQEFEKWSKYYDVTLSMYRWKQVKVWDLSTITGGTPGGLGGDINGLQPVLSTDLSTVDLYVTTDNRFYHFTDPAAYIDPGYPGFDSLPTTATVVAGSFDFISAPAGTQFRGLALVPEPASLGLLAIGAAALLMRRRVSR